MAAATKITDTGIRGFLKWFKGQQPGIYAKAAPVIAAKVPQAFSGYHDGGWKTAGMSNAQVNAMMNRQFSGLGDDSTGDDSLDSWLDAGSAETDLATSSDITPTLETIDVPDITAAPATVDVSTAANTGTASTSTTSAIGSIIAGVSSLFLTSAQVSAQQQLVNTNLARAAAGLPPLTSSVSAAGIPVITGTSLTSGTLLLLLGGGALLLLVMSGKRGRA